MSDTLFALWIGLAAVLLLLFAYAAIINLRNRQGRPVVPDELVSSLQPVDLDQFSGLIETFKAPSGLSGQEVNRLQHERSQGTIEALRRMADNAALLQKLGYAQLNNGNELISELAQQMIDAGVHVRLYTFIALATLHLGNAFRLAGVNIIPAARAIEMREMMSASLLPAYQQLKEKAGNLTCLKFSGVHEALTASL
jgi:hypothetical protein